VSFNGGAWDVFVTKLSVDGAALDYSTYLGGSTDDLGFGIATDQAGQAYVTGPSNSMDFPTTPGAFDTTFSGGPLPDAFVTKLNADGSELVYSTFVGGSSYDEGFGIAVDSAGRAHMMGDTLSSDFPTTTAAFDTTFAGSFDAYVIKLSRNGGSLVYSTFLGGSGLEDALGIALDPGGRAYLIGRTESADFPTTVGAFDTTFNGGTFGDAFVTKLTRDGQRLIYSTYLGGTGGDACFGIAVDRNGRAYVTGDTDSVDFPTTAGAFDTTFNGVRDAFLAMFNRTGTTLRYSTYIGGSLQDFGRGVAIDPAGNAYIIGNTDAPDFPTTTGAFQVSSSGGIDTFVTKIRPR
jgi:hypothetical protein